MNQTSKASGSSVVDPTDAPSLRFLPAAIGLAACSMLIFEVTLTRIFSVILFYHYGFMVISLALLGIGLSGVYVYLYPEKFPRSDAPRQAARAAAAFAVSTVVMLLLFHRLVTVRTTWPLETYELVFVFLMMIVPLFFAGLAIAIPLARFTERVGKLYGADLIGAAIGTALVIPLLALLGGHRTVIASACMASLSAVFYARAQQHRGAQVRGWIAFAACATTLAISGPTDLFRLKFTKLGAENNVVLEEWNSFSRVTVLEGKKRQRWGWNMSPSAPGEGVRRHQIRIDGGAGTPLLEFDGDLSSVEFLRYDISALGYQVRPQQNVTIIGAGGGRDILTAKSFGVERVHAVEINPIIVDIARTGFESFTRSAYDLPGVTWAVVDGRSFLATSKETYDHVQISAVDTLAASAAGALALVEQSLYTTEAFLDYYDHLSEDGILSITRPFNLQRIEVTLRMIDLVRAAWHKRGVEDPGQHLVVIGRRDKDEGASSWGLLLASRSPFREPELAELRSLCDSLGFGFLYVPGASDNVEEIEKILGPSREDFLRDYSMNVAATTDDHPYFFYFRKPAVAVQKALSFGKQKKRARATPDLLPQLLLFVVVLTMFSAFLLPMALGRLKLRAARGSGSSLTYFAGIGLGFMVVEIALLQRYTLLLGQPVYAFAVTLGTMLVFSGMGSLWTHRVPQARLLRVSRLALSAILVGIAVHAWFMPHVMSLGMHWGLPLRLALTVSTIGPLALLMGVALPSGMRLIGQQSPQVLAWAWGVNGSLSVLGTVLAMSVSVFFGTTSSLVLGMAAYTLALLTPWKSAS